MVNLKLLKILMSLFCLVYVYQQGRSYRTFHPRVSQAFKLSVYISLYDSRDQGLAFINSLFIKDPCTTEICTKTFSKKSMWEWM